jgi:hypothetical protein
VADAAAEAALATANGYLATIAIGSGGGGGGSATSALQTAGNTTLASILTGLGGLATSALQGAANTVLTAISGYLATIAGTVSAGKVSVSDAAAETSLATIATAAASQATAANQTAGNTSLASILAGLSSLATGALQTAGNTTLTAISGYLATLAGAVSAGKVAVSGTFWQATQPVSLASLPALAAGSAIIGAVGVPTLAYSSMSSVNVGTTSTSVATAGQFGTSLTITTLPASTTNIWVAAGPAVVGQGWLIAAGGASITFGPGGIPMPTGAIYAITDGSASQPVAIAGG